MRKISKAYYCTFVVPWDFFRLELGWPKTQQTKKPIHFSSTRSFNTRPPPPVATSSSSDFPKVSRDDDRPTGLSFLSFCLIEALSHAMQMLLRLALVALILEEQKGKTCNFLSRWRRGLSAGPAGAGRGGT